MNKLIIFYREENGLFILKYVSKRAMIVQIYHRETKDSAVHSNPKKIIVKWGE